MTLLSLSNFFPICVFKLSIFDMCWNWPGRFVSVSCRCLHLYHQPAHSKLLLLCADAGYGCSPAGGEDDGRDLLSRSGFEYSTQGEFTHVKKYLIFLPSRYVNTYSCVFPDVSAASPLCWESSVRAFWDPATQVSAQCFILFIKLFL